MRSIALLLAPVVLAASYGNAAELIQDFDAKPLDTSVWNTCQLDGPVLEFPDLTMPGGVERRALRNVIDHTTSNKDKCTEAEAATASASTAARRFTLDVETTGLGPSLIERSEATARGAVECPKGGPKAQRNELRLQKNRTDLIHRPEDPHWYSLTFRADGKIPSCGSARWIIAQWKQERGEKGDKDPSPFLAQRFDNGVLHVTVQSGHCRCAIAQASGDYDAQFSAFSSRMSGPQKLVASSPLKCIKTNLPSTAPETPCEPTELKVFTIGGGRPPQLPDPKSGWARMTYYIRGGADKNGQVDVYAGGEFIVRATGLIGYETPDPGDVKFKFGHYRDRLNDPASVSVDRFCLSKEPRGCAPDLKVAPAE